MGEKIERLKRIAKNMGQTFKSMGVQTGKILESLEKSDKEMNEKLNKAIGSVDDGGF